MLIDNEISPDAYIRALLREAQQCGFFAVDIRVVWPDSDDDKFWLDVQDELERLAAKLEVKYPNREACVERFRL